jgi:hypothetical protein
MCTTRRFAPAPRIVEGAEAAAASSSPSKSLLCGAVTQTTWACQCSGSSARHPSVFGSF